MIAHCFIKVYPRTGQESNRAIFTYLSPFGKSITGTVSEQFQPISSMEIPMVKDDEGRSLAWFQISLVLLPDIPLRVQVNEPLLSTHDRGEIQLLLQKDRVHVMHGLNVRSSIEYLGRREEAIFYQDLGYNYLQGMCLARSGAYLIHYIGERRDAAQVIRYNDAIKQFEYLFICPEDSSLQPHVYVSQGEDVLEIAWEYALNLDRFSIGLSPT